MESKEKLLVHLLDQPDASHLEFLRAQLEGNIEITAGRILPDPAHYEILVAGRPEREHLAASPRLRILVVPFAGPPANTRQLLAEFPHLILCNLHYNADVAAEMALALLLSAAKFILPCDRALRKNDWTPRYNPPPAMLLLGKTVLILGFGEIGQRVGRVCHALGMRVLAVRKNPGKTAGLDYPVDVYSPERLAELLPQAQVLLLALPSTAETRTMIGADQIRSLPKGAVLVNIGRGETVDETALYEALRDGTLSAAGLDVWYHYPAGEAERTQTPPSSLPFHELENVVMSPHRGFSSTESERLRMTHLARLLNAIRRGELPNRIDAEVGY